MQFNTQLIPTPSYTDNGKDCIRYHSESDSYTTSDQILGAVGGADKHILPKLEKWARAINIDLSNFTVEVDYEAGSGTIRKRKLFVLPNDLASKAIDYFLVMSNREGSLDKHVYLFYCDGYYKIGVARDVESRRYSVQHAVNHGTLDWTCIRQVRLEQILYYGPFSRLVEYRLHQKFANCRQYGEWFILSQADVSALQFFVQEALSVYHSADNFVSVYDGKDAFTTMMYFPGS